MVQIEKIEHQFVRVYDEHSKPLFFGLITGFVVGSDGIGLRAMVYNHATKVSHVVSFENLRVILPSEMHGGLVGLSAKHEVFGDGVIKTERWRREVLEVQLLSSSAKVTHASDWYPLTAVTVLKVSAGVRVVGNE